MTESMAERLPPQALEMEVNVLGAILIDREAADTAFGLLSPADFYKGAHKRIFEVAREVYERNQSLDHALLCSALRDAGALDEIGGLGYIADVVSAVPTSAHVEEYCRIVKRAAQLRGLIAAGTNLARDGFTAGADPVELANSAQNEIEAQMTGDSNDPVPVQDCLAAVFDALDGKVTGPLYHTGLPPLDAILGGMLAGNLAIIAARPGNGKSTFACHLARQWSNAGVPALLLSYEMLRKEIGWVLTSGQSGVYLNKVGECAPENYDKVISAAEVIRTWPLLLAASPNFPPPSPQLMGYCRKAIRKSGVKIVIADYLQQIPVGNTAGENRQEDVAGIARTLKRVALETGTLVVACAQLNRALDVGAGRKPRLSDLRESGVIEQAADIVILLHLDAEAECADSAVLGHKALSVDTLAIIAKNRNGATGETHLTWERGWRQFHAGQMAAGYSAGGE